MTPQPPKRRKRFNPWDSLHRFYLEMCRTPACICAMVGKLNKEQLIHIRNWCNFLLKEE